MSEGAKAGGSGTGYWAQRGSSRGRASRLRLLGALRGAAELVWTGGSLPVAYELNVFGAGDQRSASGSLEGDFSAATALDPADPSGPPATDVRLRLENGDDIDIDITSFADELVEFDARKPAQLEGLVSIRPG